MTRPTRKEALDWAKAGEPTPKVLAWSPQPPPLECTKCGGPIDDASADVKRKLHAKIGTVYTPPKVCATCLWKALTEMDVDTKGTGQ